MLDATGNAVAIARDSSAAVPVRRRRRRRKPSDALKKAAAAVGKLLGEHVPHHVLLDIARAAKRIPHPAIARNQDRAVMMVLQPDGSFRASNEDARQWLKAQHFHKFERCVMYVYRIRDEGAFRKAHKFAKYLRENSEDFAGKTDHEVLKQLQSDHDIACDRVRIEGTKMTALIPRSLAPGVMDGGEWDKTWRAIANAAAHRYFGVLDADAVEKMLELMPEPA